MFSRGRNRYGTAPLMKISPQSTRRAQSIFVFLCDLCVLGGYFQRSLHVGFHTNEW